MKNFFLLSLMIIFLIFSTNLFSEVKKIEITIKQPFLAGLSPDVAKIIAITKAKREAFEMAGTYIENLRVVKENRLKKDEIFAIATGVLKVKIVSQKKDSFGIILKAELKVNTSILEKSVKKLLKDKKLLEKYKEVEKREIKLLRMIRDLEEENRKLRNNALKKKFIEVSRKITATELNKKALTLYNNGYFEDPDKAIEYLTKAIEKDPEYADAYNNLGIAYENKGKYNRAIYYYEKALKIFLSKFGKDYPKVAEIYCNLGKDYFAIGNYDKAIYYYNKALEIYLSNLDKNHLKIADIYSDLGFIYKTKGKYDKAIYYYEKALKIYLSNLGKDHPRVAEIYGNLGIAYEGKGDYNRAFYYYEKALRIFLSKFGKNYPKVALSYFNIGFLYIKKENFPKAKENFEKAYLIFKKNLGENHPYTQKSKPKFVKKWSFSVDNLWINCV